MDSPETTTGPAQLEQPADTSRWPTVLLVLTTVLAILAIVTVWARVQLLDTDEWVDESSELLDNPEIQEALSRTLVDTLYDSGAVRTALEERLPEDLQGVASLLAGTLREPLTTAVVRVLDSQPVQERWEAANRRAHETLVNVLRDETRTGVTTAEGTVTIELRPLVIQTGEALGIPAERLEAIPEDAGRFVVFESAELDRAQTLVRVLDVVAWFLFVAVVAAYAALVAASRDRRRMLGRVGASLIVVGATVVLVQAIARRLLLDALVERPENRSAGAAAAAGATGLIRQMGWSAVAYGLLIAGFAALIGSHRWAIAVRRTIGPAFRASSGAVAAATAVFLLLLWWWSPGRTFSGWTTGLTLAALIVGAVVVLRRRILAEAGHG